MAGPGYTFIDEAEAASSSTSVLEITGIPDTYRHLELIFAGVGESISYYSFLAVFGLVVLRLLDREREIIMVLMHIGGMSMESIHHQNRSLTH